MEGKKGSEHVHPEDLGFAKLFEVILDTNRLLGLAAVAKTGKKIRVEVYLSPVAPEHARGGSYVWPSGTTARSETGPRSSPRSCFVTSPSEEPMYKPDITRLPNVVSDPRAPLQEAQEVELTEPPSERRCACSLWENYRPLREHRR